MVKNTLYTITWSTDKKTIENHNQSNKQNLKNLKLYQNQDSPVVSRKVKKKQHTRATYTTTGVLFTATNAVKFAIAVTRSS